MPHLISIIVLAAGKSTRFGSNKLLAEINGESMIERVVKEALASKANETLVVLGHESERVRNALSGLKCRFVLNERFEEGQSSSVKKGIEAIRDHAEAVLILPGDMAFVSFKTVDAVIEEYRRNRDIIVVASYAKSSGHPILLDRSLFQEIMGINEKSLGLKRITGKHSSRIKRVEVDTDDILLDVDTKEDLEKRTSKKRIEGE
jgi:molybdenum cofactor cytidylyltransferase